MTTLVLAHCLERSSLCSSRCMLHFLLLPLLLSACYERPGSPARASHALCVSKRIIIARAITFHVPSFWAAVGLYLPVPATRRPRTLLPRVQSSIRDHICCVAIRSLCKAGEPELYTRPSLLHKNASFTGKNASKMPPTLLPPTSPTLKPRY